MQSTVFNRFNRSAVLVLLAAVSSACSMDKTKQPALAGPSEFAVSMEMRATPEVLERDGSSQSVIRVFARDFTTGKTAAARRTFALTLDPVDAGTLSASQVTTGADGWGSVIYTAARSSQDVEKVTIGAVPLAGTDELGNSTNTREQVVTIWLRGANAPTSSFTFAPAAPKQFDLVTFDASGTTLDGKACMDTCKFTWTFGAEGSATGEVVTHRFENIGTHTVTLSVTGPSGIVVTTRKSVLVTAAAAPEAKIQASSTTIKPGQTVRFTGLLSESKDGAKIVEWSWDFGNGETASGPTVSTTYEDVGSYLVTLTVKDSNGQTKSAFVTVTVQEPEAP